MLSPEVRSSKCTKSFLLLVWNKLLAELENLGRFGELVHFQEIRVGWKFYFAGARLQFGLPELLLLNSILSKRMGILHDRYENFERGLRVAPFTCDPFEMSSCGHTSGMQVLKDGAA